MYGLLVLIFLLCHSLKIVPSLLEILGHPPDLVPGVLPLSHLLLTLNCRYSILNPATSTDLNFSVNFLVYYLASGRALSRLIPVCSARHVRPCLGCTHCSGAHCTLHTTGTPGRLGWTGAAGTSSTGGTRPTRATP